MFGRNGPRSVKNRNRVLLTVEKDDHDRDGHQTGDILAVKPIDRDEILSKRNSEQILHSLTDIDIKRSSLKSSDKTRISAIMILFFFSVVTDYRHGLSLTFFRPFLSFDFHFIGVFAIASFPLLYFFLEKKIH